MKKYLTPENLGWVLVVLVGLMLTKAGVSMLIGTQEMIENFTFLKLTPYMVLIGLLELIGAVLLVLPKTSLYGAVLVSSLMSGAVALHLSCMGGTGVLIPIFVGLFAWSGHCLRKYYCGCS